MTEVEEVESLRSISFSEEKIEQWSQALPSLKHFQQSHRSQDIEGSIHFLHLAKCDGIEDMEQWQQVPAGQWPAATAPPQVPL